MSDQQHTPKTPYDHTSEGWKTMNSRMHIGEQARRHGYLRALEDMKPYRDAVDALVGAAVAAEHVWSNNWDTTSPEHHTALRLRSAIANLRYVIKE
jgi:hypothetical protein